MAFEFPGRIVSLDTTTTGLKQFRFVKMNTGGHVLYPAKGDGTIGVLQSGSTGSTRKPQAVSVMIDGVSKLDLVASTNHAGSFIAASSRGSACTGGPSAGHYIVGRLWQDATGAGVGSVQIINAGYSTSFV